MSSTSKTSPLICSSHKPLGSLTRSLCFFFERRKVSNKKKPTKIISTQEPTYAQQAYEKLALIVAQAVTDFKIPMEELTPKDNDYKLAEIAMIFIKMKAKQIKKQGELRIGLDFDSDKEEE